MPRARWGISSADVDNFDRTAQYTPYTGPIPSNGVYRWKIKVAKFIAGTRDKFPSLRVGLELLPRNKDEKRFAGYFIMAFLPVSDKTAFRYVPLLDALGVSGRDFENRTIVDEEGNIQKIGPWRNDGKTEVAAQLNDGADANGNSRKEISWFGALNEDVDADDDDDPEFDDADADYVDDVDEVDDEEEEEDEPAPPRRTASRSTSAPTRTSRARRTRRTEEDF